MVKDFKEILEEHNRLQERFEKADQILDKEKDPPQSWIDEYSKILIRQSDNFEEVYFYYEKADVDRLINTNKTLSIKDFNFCRKTAAGELCL